MEPIDKQTIDKLKAYETSYQEEAWEDFERFRKKKKKRPVIIFWRMAAGIIISILIGLEIQKLNESGPEQAAVNKTEKKNNHLSVLASGERNKTIADTSATTKKVISSQNLKNTGTKNREEKILLPQNEENLNRVVFSEEDNFKPYLLQPHTFNGILVRPKTPFIAPYPASDENNKDKKKHNTFNLSIAIAGLSNQAENVVSQQNFGLRGTTEIALGRKTELSTGIYIGRESLYLINNTIPFSTPAGMSQLNQANYRWLNIEIPLNMRYRVWQKGAFAFSTQAGISMMGAFDQTSQLFYENRRTVVLVSVGSNGEVQEVATTFIDKEVKNNVSNARRVSLGTALNFSFGIHYPLGKNKLSVEPFFKYPIGAFTAENLHYSSIGVQLRWSLYNTDRNK